MVLNCLRSIIRETRGIQYAILVVDNASGGDDFEAICTVFTKVIWIQLEYNSGFARANNEGIRRAKGQVILLLNPDTIVEGNAIEQCYRQFVQDNYVACGVQLLNPDRTPQISGSYFVRGGLDFLRALL